MCQAIGVSVPEIVKKMQDSKFMYGFGIWMIGNNLQSALVTTGAFEISIDNQVIYSKLQTG